MKQRQLEILLQQIPKTPTPIPHLEQYMTPATIAADVIFTAYNWGDIQDKFVVDLGCGTGIFAIGPLLTRLIAFFERQFVALADSFGADPYRFPTLIPARR